MRTIATLSCILLELACRASGTEVAQDETTTATATHTLAGASGVRVFAVSNMGMHCIDRDYAVMSLFPPHNVLQAQVVAIGASGVPTLLKEGDVRLRYEAQADASGSRNGSSVGKSNFWQFAATLYGRTLAVGEGFAGLFMPDDATSERAHALPWSESRGLFAADGIPAVARDDQGLTQHYSLLRVEATDAEGAQVLGFVDAVVPVSDETSCASCHATGAVAARAADIDWAADEDSEAAARKNVLILHDARHATNLLSLQPVACAGCHDSPAIDAAVGWTHVAGNGLPSMSAVMHGYHADKMRDAGGAPFVDLPTAPGESPADPSKLTCYQCHPGTRTRCMRGAMADVMVCQNCHGSMSSVGGGQPLAAGTSLDGHADGLARRPWVDLPRCSGCHTGDALTLANDGRPMALDHMRTFQAFAPGDGAASPLSSRTSRFAENEGLLFRDSRGHGGVACTSCHGSPHALWTPSGGDENDRVAPTQLQGHAGLISECDTCHAGQPIGLGGPHGMHPAGSQEWVDNHPTFYHKSPSSCWACHGKNMRGTVLSKASVDRDFDALGTQVHIPAGAKVSCVLCHGLPSSPIVPH